MALSGSKLAREIVNKTLMLKKRLSSIPEERLRPFYMSLHPKGDLILAVPQKNPSPRIAFTIIPDEEGASLEILSWKPGESIEEPPVLNFAMIPAGRLPGEWLKFLKRGGFQPSPDRPAPFLFLQTEDRMFHASEPRILRHFLLLVNGVLLAMKQGLFSEKSRAEEDWPPLVIVSGDPIKPDTRVLTQAELEALDEIMEDQVQEIALDEAKEGRSWRRKPGLPADLIEWKEIDLWASDVIVSLVGERALADPVTLALFFGSPLEAKKAMEFDRRSAVDAYLEWLAFDHRPAPGGKTKGEDLLETDLPPRKRSLLEARARAVPSIFKIEWIEKGKYVVLSDLFTGETFTVWDISLSETAEEGVFFPGKIYRAGNYNFLTIFGPALAPHAVSRVLEILESLGMKFTPSDMKEKAHLFGRLFVPVQEIYEQWKEGPVLQNTDGDPLLFHTAVFDTSDPEVLAETLHGRKDMDYHKEENSWTWFKKKKPGRHVMGENIILGTIRLIGDEVLLETNSAKRYKKGRKILEKIPGTTFRDVTTQALTRESIQDRPLDDKLPRPEEEDALPPEELRIFMERELEKFYMGWLDEPIPALGGKTPRQCCATEDGRRKVAALIRTMVPASGPGGIKVHPPKKELFRELGIEEP